MAQKRQKASPKATGPKAANVASRTSGQSNGRNGHKGKPNPWSKLFSDLACATARYAGHPLAFLTATSLVIIWALTGPLFGFSDTWQLVINTSTTIVTFLMVFLIQHTQNRDTLAVQLKLSELIIAAQDAENKLAVAEDLSEEELEALHEQYRTRAEATLEHLNQRREQLKRAS
jgi:low affinity Fe/Cu permease